MHSALSCFSRLVFLLPLGLGGCGIAAQQFERAVDPPDASRHVSSVGANLPTGREDLSKINLAELIWQFTGDRSADPECRAPRLVSWADVSRLNEQIAIAGSRYEAQRAALQQDKAKNAAAAKIAAGEQALLESGQRLAQLQADLLNVALNPVQGGEGGVFRYDGVGIGSKHVAHAVATFYKCESDAEALKDRRALIQTVIMTAAKRRCEVYKQFLASMDGNVSFAFESVTMASSVIATLFDSASQEWAAVAGISSGLGAQVGKSFFKDTALPVITTGIDMKRRDIEAEISGRRHDSLRDYTLPDAIGDATRYSGACSLIEGLQHIKHVVAQPVGEDKAREILMAARDRVEQDRILALPLDQQADELAKLQRSRDTLRAMRAGSGAGTSATAKAVAADGQSVAMVPVLRAAQVKSDQTAQALVVATRESSLIEGELAAAEARLASETADPGKATAAARVATLKARKGELAEQIKGYEARLANEQAVLGKIRQDQDAADKCLGQIVDAAKIQDHFADGKPGTGLLYELGRPVRFAEADAATRPALRRAEILRLRAELPGLAADALSQLGVALAKLKPPCT